MSKVSVLWATVSASLAWLLLSLNVIQAADRPGEVAAPDDPLAAISKSLPEDPVQIFHWVRDKTRYECYRGSLRGPVGTFWARAGNSLDRSDLLADLLRRTGRRCRIVQGTLTDADARQLIHSMFPIVSTFDLEKLVESARGSNPDQSSVFAGRKTGEWLTQLPTSRPADDARLLAAAREHFWVEVEDGASWTILDPALRNRQPGAALARAENRSGEAPTELRHLLELRVEVTTALDQQRSVEEILSKTFAAAELTGRDVVLEHAPSSSARGRTYAPVLRFGDQRLAGKRVYEVAPSGAKLVAVHVLFRWTAPGAEAKVYRYEVLQEDDELPVAQILQRRQSFLFASGWLRADAAGGQEPGKSKGPQETPRPAAPAHPLLGNFIAAVQAKAEAQKESQRENNPASADELRRQIGMGIFLESDANAIQLALKTGVAAYVSQPRVLAVGTGSLRTRFVVNETSVVGRPGQATAIARAVRSGIDLGALAAQASVAERMTGSTPLSCVAILAEAKAQGVPLRAYRPGELAQLGASELPANLKRDIRSSLEKGHTVLAPGRAVPVNGVQQAAALSVDPGTGRIEALGLTDGALAAKERTDEAMLRSGLAQIALQGAILYASIKAIESATGEMTEAVDPYSQIRSQLGTSGEILKFWAKNMLKTFGAATGIIGATDGVTTKDLAEWFFWILLERLLS